MENPNSGVENYQIYSGTHPSDPETSDTYEVQSRKKGGKYTTHLTTNRKVQALMHYTGRNVGPGYTKRILLNGKVYHKTVGN